MRRPLLALATAILALGLAFPASGADSKRATEAKPAKIDKGMRIPPLRVPNYHKALWMSEWVACWRPESMDALAVELPEELPLGTPVTLVGDGILIEEHALVAGTIGYEIATGLNTGSRRAQRLVRDG